MNCGLYLALGASCGLLLLLLISIQLIFGSLHCSNSPQYLAKGNKIKKRNNKGGSSHKKVKEKKIEKKQIKKKKKQRTYLVQDNTSSPLFCLDGLLILVILEHCRQISFPEG
tara:strand:- start:39 stop:374 length:336 start_codon:yes stop_codon:yes gene_type:complete